MSLYPPLETLEKRSPTALTLRELLYLKRVLYLSPHTPDADILLRVVGKEDKIVEQHPERDRKCIKERKFNTKGRYICFLIAERRRLEP